MITKANEKELTIREQAAIELFVRGIITRKSELYKIAHPGSLDDVERLGQVASCATRWFGGVRIQDALRKSEAVVNDEKKRNRDAMVREIESQFLKDSTTDGKLPGGLVDYSKPANQLRKLNELIHSAPDQKDELDALKVLIAQTARDPQERTKEGRQVRAYLPLSCDSCPLYLNEKQKLNR